MKPYTGWFIRNCTNGHNSNLVLGHIYERLHLYVTPVDAACGSAETTTFAERLP